MNESSKILIGHAYSTENLDHRWSKHPPARHGHRVDRQQNSIQNHQDGDLHYAGDNHLVTIAGTGAGKGRSVIIPNLVSYPGPVVVFDPKGENYAVTSASRKKEFKHRVWKIAPFEANPTAPDNGCLNPFDIFSLHKETVETGATSLSDLLSDPSPTSALDHNYHLLANDLISGLIAHVAADLPERKRNLVTVKKILSKPSAEASLKVLLSGSRTVLLNGTRKQINEKARDDIQAFLNLPETLRANVWNTARRLLQPLQVEGVRRAVEKSSFDINDIVSGQPLTIFIVIPPEKLKRYSALVRLWLGVLMKAIFSRKNPPDSRSLFLLDECAKFGAFQILEDAITLGRGYGMQVWTFWQDMSQIKALYPSAWPTILANSEVTQFFGPRNQMISGEFAQFLGPNVDAIADEVRRLRLSDQITIIAGGAPQRSTRLDSLYDWEIKRHCADNPIYGPFDPTGRDEVAAASDSSSNFGGQTSSVASALQRSRDGLPGRE